MSSCYSFDVQTKSAFEREIEHIKNGHRDNLNDYEEKIIDYLASRIKEIIQEHGEGPIRES